MPRRQSHTACTWWSTSRSSPPAWGNLGIDGATSPVPAERGSYPQFYRLLAEALRGRGPLPVDPAEALQVLKIIEDVHVGA
ncbi:hypothetical protein QFZ79_002709 [Arthrobacter sp. V4I6]|uniref:hypothetical protein n=1 Tax=unclassified Arthrobacter TaxID=235627 RepID=UPI002788F470|nr:hypothetical protein [Arthrobacter sp. V1I7]MDQ0854598.1 hypothetical protein [Arthrobacter sp. V4I6]